MGRGLDHLRDFAPREARFVEEIDLPVLLEILHDIQCDDAGQAGEFGTNLLQRLNVCWNLGFTSSSFSARSSSCHLSNLPLSPASLRAPSPLSCRELQQCLFDRVPKPRETFPLSRCRHRSARPDEDRGKPRTVPLQTSNG